MKLRGQICHLTSIGKVPMRAAKGVAGGQASYFRLVEVGPSSSITFFSTIPILPLD